MHTFTVAKSFRLSGGRRVASAGLASGQVAPPAPPGLGSGHPPSALTTGLQGLTGLCSVEATDLNHFGKSRGF